MNSPRPESPQAPPLFSDPSFIPSSGRTLEELLQRSEDLLLDPAFPTPKCLEPAAVAAYSLSAVLSEAEQSHLEECIHCSTLLDMAKPDPERLKRFLAEVELQSTSRAVRSAPRLAWSEKLRGFLHSFQLPALGLAAAGSVLLIFLMVNKKPSAIHTSALGGVESPYRETNPSEISSSPRLIEASLVYSDDRHRVNDVVLPVQSISNGRVAQQSVPTAAAAAATFEITKRSQAPSSDSRKALEMSVVQALAAQVPKDESDSVSNFWFKRNIPHVERCNQLAKSAGDPKEVTVTTESGLCVFSNAEAKLTFNPQHRVFATLEFARVLKNSEGDVSILSDAAPNIQISMAPRTITPSNASAVRLVR